MTKGRRGRQPKRHSYLRIILCSEFFMSGEAAVSIIPLFPSCMLK